MKILNKMFAGLACALLAACAQQPPPAAFTGPVAHLSMTETARGGFAANVVYVSQINGQDFLGEIYPSQPPPDVPLNPTNGVITTIDIPAQPTKFTLIGRSIF